MYRVALVLILSLRLLSLAEVRADPLPLETLAEVNVGGMPESVLAGPQYLYASNLGTGSNPLAKDGNGYISKLSYSGDLIEQRFISLRGQLDGPTGMALIGNRLFAADLDEVIGFDLDGVASPLRIDLRSQGVSFLNDLVAVSDRHLIVSGTNVKKLFLIDTVAESFTPISLDFTLNHPNGLAYDPATAKLYVAANKVHSIGSSVSNGEILVLDLDIAGAAAMFDTRLANAGFFLDGISLFGDGEAIYSDWVSGGGATGTLRRFDIESLAVDMPTPLGLRGFADFDWNPARRILAAPNLLDGRVRLLTLPVPEPAAGWQLLLVATGAMLVRYRSYVSRFTAKTNASTSTTKLGSTSIAPWAKRRSSRYCNI